MMSGLGIRDITELPHSCWLQAPHTLVIGTCGALISTLKPWVPFVGINDVSDTILYNTLSPEIALRSEPGIMSGEPTAVLKAAAFEITVGSGDFPENQVLSLVLLRSAIAGLEANEGSRLALDTVLRGLQVSFIVDSFYNP